MSNEELATLIQDRPADRQKYLLELWSQNQPITRAIVRRFCGPEDREDGLQESFLCLARTVDRWKPDGGSNFLTFYRKNLQRHLVREILCNSSVSIPEGVQVQAARLRKAETAFYSENGREPTNKEIADLLGIPVKDVQALRNASLSLPDSLDRPLQETEDGISLGDTVAAPGSFEDELLADGSLAAILQAIKQELTDQEQDIVIQRASGKNFGQIGEAVGETEKKTRQLFYKASRKLKYSENFTRSLPAVFYAGGLESFRHSWTSCVERALGF